MPTGYDENLLAQAPLATREARQEGYNIDLLDEERATSTPPVRTRTPATLPVGAAAANAPSANSHPIDDPEYGSERGKNIHEYSGLSPAKGPRTPFWRSTKGKIVIAILALLIIGAIVGGAVGGTVGKSNKPKNATTNDSSTSLPAVSTQSAASDASTRSHSTSTFQQGVDSSTAPSTTSSTSLAPAQTLSGVSGGAGTTLASSTLTDTNTVPSNASPVTSSGQAVPSAGPGGGIPIGRAAINLAALDTEAD